MAARPTSEMLDALFNPKTVAIVGASPRSPYYAILKDNLSRYSGQVFPVNPRYSVIGDRNCYPSLRALPSIPEHVLCITPAGSVPAVLREAQGLGVPAFTVYASGFGERGNISLDNEVKDILAAGDMALCGPNCMGAVSAESMMVGFTAPLLDDVLPGTVSVISHSGGSLGTWVRGARERGIGLRFAVSSGNELAVHTADYLEYLAEDPGTSAIVLQYIEAVGDGRRFVAAAQKALRSGKPILAVKSGRSAMSEERVQTHTGRLAPPARDFEAAARSTGITLFSTMDELLEGLVAFRNSKLPAGGRIAVHAISGAVCNHMIDVVQESGPSLRFAQLSSNTQQKLQELLGQWTDVSNPLDSSWPGQSDADTFGAVNRLLAEDAQIDALLLEGEVPHNNGGARGRYSGSQLECLRRHAKIPVYFFSRMPYTPDDALREEIEQLGFSFLHGARNAVQAVDAVVRWSGRRRAQKAAVKSHQAPGIELPPASEIFRHDMLAPLFRQYGIKVADGQVVGSSAEAAQWASTRWPVALKRLDIVHKSDQDAVALNIRNRDEMNERFGSLQQLSGDAGSVPTYYVQEMFNGGWEIYIGGHDSEFGPVLAVGLGGIWSEYVHDTVVSLAPVSADEALDMLRSLRAWPVLVRNRKGQQADVDWLSDTISRFARLLRDACRQGVVSLEANPVIVADTRDGGCVVDLRGEPRRVPKLSAARST